MSKKLIFAASAVALVGFLLTTSSYLRTAATKVQEQVNDAEPLAFKLDRAKQMIKDLDPEIHDAAHTIAYEEVSVKSLEDELAASAARLAQSEKDILQLTADVESDNSYFVYAGEKYSKEQVQNDLVSRFERHKVMQDTHDMHTKQLAARNATLKAAREKLTAMENARRELVVSVDNLSARLKTLEVAQASSELAVDDSKLAQTKALAKDIAARIDVAEKLVNATQQLPGQINLDHPEDRDAVKEITAYFGKEAAEPKAVAAQ